MNLTRASEYPSLTATVVDAQAQCAAAERPVDGRFSFADTPHLTAALRRGDEAAYRWLHAQWNARLVRYCFALARGDDATVAEIAQAAYLRVLPDETALWNWLACAARSAAADLRRTGGRYRRAMARFADWLPGRRETTAALDSEQPLLEALDRVLARLDPADRQLLEGRYFQGRSLEDIGAPLGLSNRAVEGRLARLRRHLKQLIAHELKSDQTRP